MPITASSARIAKPGTQTAPLRLSEKLCSKVSRHDAVFLTSTTHAASSQSVLMLYILEREGQHQCRQHMAEKSLTSGEAMMTAMHILFGRGVLGGHASCELTRVLASAGMHPIAETYMVLTHAFIVESDRRAAFKVFQSMNAAGVDVERGWLLLCKDLLRYGYAVS